MIRRRLFVDDSSLPSGNDLRIVEVRDDLGGFDVVVKQGHLGCRDTRRVAKFVSFATRDEAVAQADATENELLASGFVDLRTRLASFKDASPATLF